MAQADLHRIIGEIYGELKSSFRQNVDTFPHVLEISAKHVEEHLLLQLTEILQPDRKAKTHVLSRRFGGLSREEAEASLFAEPQRMLAERPESQANKIRSVIKSLSQEYAVRVYQELKGKSKNYDLEFTGSPTEYRLKVTYTGPKVTLNASKPEFLQKNPADIFRHIRDNGLAPARDYIRRALVTQLKGIIPTGFTKETIFDLGHITAVSTIKIDRALAKIEQLKKTAVYQKTIQDSLDFQVLSKFNKFGDPEVEKAFEGQVVYARPEAATFNNWQSNYEAGLLRDVQNAFKKVLENNIEWADQGGSDSVVEFIAKDLMAAAKKHNAKVSSNISKDIKPSKAVEKQAKNRKETTTVVNGNNAIAIPDIKTRGLGVSSINLRTLIPMLNDRLPEIVRSHMGQSGRLVNRTGRFAESAEIVDIGENSTITYSYMRNPYQVFERDGPRDPRPLIEMSIRELATGIIQGRFNLRRV
jgi:hypothetical protein